MKKMFKVLSAMPKKDGQGSYWVRCGNAFENKDGSLNLYLDTFPRTFQLQVREMDEEDLASRNGRRTNHDLNPSAPTPALDAPPF